MPNPPSTPQPAPQPKPSIIEEAKKIWGDKVVITELPPIGKPAEPVRH